MFSLIIKDLLLLKKIILWGLVYMIFFSVAFQGLEGGAFLFAVALTHVFIMTTSAYEDKNNADVLLNSLPLKKERIVVSKYISGWIDFVISTVFYLEITFLIGIFKIPLEMASITIMDFMIALFFISLLNAIYLPVFFKFGYIKSRIFNFILLIVIYAGASSAISILKESQNNTLIRSSVEFLTRQNQIKIIFFIGGMVLIITALSCIISFSFYKNREF
ncbi:ABC-2 transporter permease [Garciella nitratireducens]|uniref:ABC-2 transporter permease n=1 Tax=Garciella nitratireducens TaxID=218205 RepID=UPI001BD33C77|nr:ABC-2 transporter permease [Garciella nitratireducens]